MNNHSIVYQCFHTLSKALFENCFHAEAFGLENIPKTGPALIAVNHSSFFDPFIAGAFIQRQIYFFARKTLFKNPLGSWLLKNMKAIPVARDSADVSGMKTIFKTIKEGNMLLVFPEGTRSKDGLIQKPAKPGIGMIASKTKVPIIPVRIYGSYEALPHDKPLPNFGKPINVIYGTPILIENIDPGKSNPDRYQMIADEILKSIIALKKPLLCNI